MTECPVMYQATWNGVFYNRVLHSNAPFAVLAIAIAFYTAFIVHRNKFIFFSVRFYYFQMEKKKEKAETRIRISFGIYDNHSVKDYE